MLPAYPQHITYQPLADYLPQHPGGPQAGYPESPQDGCDPLLQIVPALVALVHHLLQLAGCVRAVLSSQPPVLLVDELQLCQSFVNLPLKGLWQEVEVSTHGQRAGNNPHFANPKWLASHGCCPGSKNPTSQVCETGKAQVLVYNGCFWQSCPSGWWQ